MVSMNCGKTSNSLGRSKTDLDRTGPGRPLMIRHWTIYLNTRPALLILCMVHHSEIDVRKGSLRASEGGLKAGLNGLGKFALGG